MWRGGFRPISKTGLQNIVTSLVENLKTLIEMSNSLVEAIFLVICRYCVGTWDKDLHHSRWFFFLDAKSQFPFVNLASPTNQPTSPAAINLVRKNSRWHLPEYPPIESVHYSSARHAARSWTCQRMIKMRLHVVNVDGLNLLLVSAHPCFYSHGWGEWADETDRSFLFWGSV